MSYSQFPVALESALGSLLENCELSSWVVRGQGRPTFVVITFDTEGHPSFESGCNTGDNVSAVTKVVSEKNCCRQ
jgi:hypothetical protein